MGRFDRRFGGGSRSDRRSEPVEIKNVRALRSAGKAIIVAIVAPEASNDVHVPKSAEVMIPVSEIGGASEIKKPGDKGTLIVPTWLALDRGFIDEDDL